MYFFSNTFSVFPFSTLNKSIFIYKLKRFILHFAFLQFFSTLLKFVTRLCVSISKYLTASNQVLLWIWLKLPLIKCVLRCHHACLSLCLPCSVYYRKIQPADDSQLRALTYPSWKCRPKNLRLLKTSVAILDRCVEHLWQMWFLIGQHYNIE